MAFSWSIRMIQKRKKYAIHSESNGSKHQEIYGALEVRFRSISSEIRDHYLFSLIQCDATILKIWLIHL